MDSGRGLLDPPTSGSDVVEVKTEKGTSWSPGSLMLFSCLLRDVSTNQESLPGRQNVGFDPPKPSAERPNLHPADVLLASCQVIVCILF